MTRTGWWRQARAGLGRLLWMALLIGACNGGCQKRVIPTSRLDIEIQAEASLQLDEVEVTISADGRKDLTQRLGPAGTQPLVWQVLISNVGDSLSARIKARGLRGGGEVVAVEADATIGHAQHVVARLALSTSCVTKYQTCNATQTCISGACVPRPTFTGDPGDGGITIMTGDGGRDGIGVADGRDAPADQPADLTTAPDGGASDRGDTGPAAETGGMETPPALSLSPGMKDFGTVVTGLFAEASFEVSNTGGQPTSVPVVAIDGTEAALFTITANQCGTALAAMGKCLITVRFSPTTAGVKNARLNVSATMGGGVSATLQGLAVMPGALTITPSSQPFGSVLQGTAGTPVTLTVKNTGGAVTGTLATEIQNSTEFAISTDGCKGKVLAANETCAIAVTFTPVSAGQKSGTLTVSATPGDTGAASLTGVGLAPASLTIDPVSGSFATTTVGATGGSQIFTITNGGGLPAGGTTGIAVAVTGTQAGDFVTSANMCTGVLMPGASCKVTVTFKPSAAGARSATLGATATPGGASSVTLSGTGVAAAALRVAAASGSSAAFGSVVSGTSATQTFTVTNSGGQASSAITIAASGAGFTVAAPAAGDCVSGTTTLAPNASCSFRVVLSSTAVGPVSGTITASAAPAGGSSMLALSGTIVTPGSIGIGAAPAFVAELPNVASPPVTFTVTNNGGGRTGVLAVSVTLSTEFTLSADNCSTKTLDPAASCTVSVVFKPLTPGTKNGTLLVMASPGGPASTALTAKGLAPAALSLSTPPSFGNIVVGQASTAQAVTLTNNGDVPAGGTINIAATLGGTNSAEFRLTGTTCGMTLAEKSSCTISVVFQPTSAGDSKAATLTVNASPGGPATTSLAGNGLSPASVHVNAGAGFSSDFGSLVVGSPAQTQQFVVTNTGQQASSALTIALQGTDFRLVTPTGLDCVSLPASNATTLAPNGSCTVRVTFTPTAAVLRTGTLSVSAATGGAEMLALRGTGITPTALTVNQPSIAFGSVLQGGRSAPSTVMVTNNGDVASSALVTSLTAGEFAIATDTCRNVMLAAHTSCSISLTFSPTSASATPKTSTLTVSATGSSATVSLSGTGSKLGIDQASFVFPTTSIFAVSAPRTFTISNPSSISAGTTTALAVTLTGVSPGDFHIEPGTCSGVLGGGGGLCTVGVTFRPGTFGNRMATLSVSATPGGTVTAALSGQGQAADGQFGCVTGNDCQSTVCITYYPDNDRDTFGDPRQPANVCGFSPPGGYVNNSQDCDDADPAMNYFTTMCQNATTRRYCLDDGVVRTQACTGGGCRDAYCVGTSGVAGLFTCASNLTCPISLGCTYTSSPVNPAGSPPACGLGNTGGSIITCDGTSDCGAGQVCCTQFNCGLTTLRQCFDGACPPSQQCSPWGQVCNPLANDCPAGTTCRGGSGDVVTGQGFWTCS